MNYLLTATNNSTKKQIRLDENLTLNTVRRFMLMVQPMDETSADLKAISFLQSIVKGKAKVIANSDETMLLKVQHNV